MKTPTAKPKAKKTTQTEKVALHVAAVLRAAAPRGCVTDQPSYPGDPTYMRVLTRAGYADVHASSFGKGIALFVRFDTPHLAREIGLFHLNRCSGKWNHHDLSDDAKEAAAQVLGRFAPLWPRGEHGMAEAEFLGACQDALDDAKMRALRAWYDLPEEQQQRRRHRVPVLRACGLLPTDEGIHLGCESCGTDYSAQAERKFNLLAGQFLVGR